MFLALAGFSLIGLTLGGVLLRRQPSEKSG